MKIEKIFETISPVFYILEGVWC